MTDLDALVGVALAAVADGRAERGGPLPGGGPDTVAAAVRAALGSNLLPAVGVGERAALAGLGTAFVAGSADPADPRCAAHLHCPPLPVAVAADLIVSALNPSLDSWDQAPFGTALETEVVATLAGLVGFDPATATGAVTTGGTESNLTALLLAREQAAGPVQILCGGAAHFSIHRAARLLGLNPDAVTLLGDRLDPAALAAGIAETPGRSPIVVATAGTTDLGAVDPLAAIGAVTRSAGGWLHVDAAYGGGALFSDRLAPLLDGIGFADSVALDLHKLGWQPVAAGVLLTRDTAAWAPLEDHIAYLNADDDYPSLLSRSLRTTRRADCLPIAVTLRAYGREGLGRRVDACHDLALHAAERITAHPRLELAADVTLTTVCFRYLPVDAADPDRVNADLRRHLLETGQAVVGRTELAGAVRLKLTLLNPDATTADVDALLDLIVTTGELVA